VVADGVTTFDPGTNRYTDAAAQTKAGLQKWIFDAGAWKLAYVLQAGLDLGVPYTISNYPTGTNPVTGLPWSPAIDGLRNLTGRVHRDGTVTLWAITSTVSGSGDQGADPNKLVSVHRETGCGIRGNDWQQGARKCRRRDRLRGWGGRTRTAESVGIKIRRHCRGNLCRFGRNGAAETVRVRAAAFEFTRDRPRRQFRSSVLKPPKAAFVNSRSEIVNDACGRASMSDCCCRVRACDALRDVWRRDDVDEC
jgi:hypothetical protein